MNNDLLADLLEAFTAAPPPVTVAQSNASGARQVAAAKAAIVAGWDESKHPRGAGGRFGYSTGGRGSDKAVSTPKARDAIARRLTHERDVLKRLQADMPLHPTTEQRDKLYRARATVYALEKVASAERLRLRAPAPVAPPQMMGGQVIR